MAVAEVAQGPQEHAEPLAPLGAGAEHHPPRPGGALAGRAEHLELSTPGGMTRYAPGNVSAAASRAATDEAIAASSESKRRRSCGRVDQNGRICSGLAWKVATSGQPA